MRLVFSYSKKSITHIFDAFLYKKNFKNARDMKIAVEQAKADILAHQSTEQKAVVHLAKTNP